MNPKIIRQSGGQSILGDRQIIKLTAVDTQGSSSVMWSEVPAGAGITVHTHLNEDEIFQIVEGALEVTINGATHLLCNGDLIFMPRKIPHGFKALSATKMWVTFTPGGAEQMFIELAALPPGPPDPQSIAAICRRYGITFE